MSDSVNKPDHYNQGSVEAIDGIRAALGDSFLDYCRGNVLKYVWRCQLKGELLEDLRKAARYLEWAIEEAEKLEKKSDAGNYLEIPEGWRELWPRETPMLGDRYEADNSWVEKVSDDNCEYEWYDVRHIRKIDATNTSETPKSSIPDPGEGYRLLSKDPPEKTIQGDEFYDWDGSWREAKNHKNFNGVQTSDIYYRRKIEHGKPWVPKVGDKVRAFRLEPIEDAK